LWGKGGKWSWLWSRRFDRIYLEDLNLRKFYKRQLKIFILVLAIFFVLSTFYTLPVRPFYSKSFKIFEVTRYFLHLVVLLWCHSTYFFLSHTHVKVSIIPVWYFSKWLHTFPVQIFQPYLIPSTQTHAIFRYVILLECNCE
jgi:hypothetical protein